MALDGTKIHASASRHRALLYVHAGKLETQLKAEVGVLLALGRTPHHPSMDERFAAALPAPPNPTPLEAMAHRSATPEGKKLYARRKHTPEPVFGIIKSVLGFPQLNAR